MIQFVNAQQNTNAQTSQAIQKLEATTNQAIQRLEAQVVTALRSGKVIGNKVGIDETRQTSLAEATTSKVSEKEKVTAPPFPQRKFQDHEKVFLTREVSAVLSGKLPPKIKDPGNFIIPCTIGNRLIEHALLDLGAGINLMPYTMYVTLGLGKLQPTSITLQLVDGSIRRPKGILEDVLVQVFEGKGSIFGSLGLKSKLWEKLEQD
ncbi:uncharacterized protein LOC132178165 [Corylus avellana]|uniref:uncharacterized protein LOC132178165 n=1 Tax=Corylus avellana TaxID=13451 RepID=UPI002869F441|nr:uncharacterized protein LOC132178165 [Corylus avellana]